MGVRVQPQIRALRGLKRAIYVLTVIILKFITERLLDHRPGQIEANGLHYSTRFNEDLAEKEIFRKVSRPDLLPLENLYFFLFVWEPDLPLTHLVQNVIV